MNSDEQSESELPENMSRFVKRLSRKTDRLGFPVVKQRAKRKP